MAGRPLILLAIAVIITAVIISIPFVTPELLRSAPIDARENSDRLAAESSDTGVDDGSQTLASRPDDMTVTEPVEGDQNAERLIAIPPTDWQTIYQLNTDSSRMVEMIPPDEAEDNWQTRLTFESNRDLVRFDPITLLDGESDDLHTRCEFVRWYPVFSDFENGYPTSVRMFMCGKHRQTGRGEVSMFKIIQGSEYLYSIRFQRRVAPFELDEPDLPDSEIANFSDYLRRVIVCNGEPQHPCPGDTVTPSG